MPVEVTLWKVEGPKLSTTCGGTVSLRTVSPAVPEVRYSTLFSCHVPYRSDFGGVDMHMFGCGQMLTFGKNEEILERCGGAT